MTSGCGRPGWSPLSAQCGGLSNYSGHLQWNHFHEQFRLGEKMYVTCLIFPDSFMAHVYVTSFSSSSGQSPIYLSQHTPSSVISSLALHGGRLLSLESLRLSGSVQSRLCSRLCLKRSSLLAIGPSLPFWTGAQCFYYSLLAQCSYQETAQRRML